MAVGPNANTI